MWKIIKIESVVLMSLLFLSVSLAYSAPTVDYVSPSSGSSYSVVDAKIGVSFSTDIDSSTLNTNTFFVKMLGPGTTVTGQISYQGRWAQFTPSQFLNPGATYTVTVTTGVKDISGVAMAANYTWSFSIRTPTPPSVVSYWPRSDHWGNEAAREDAKIYIYFDDLIDTSTLNENTVILKTGTTYNYRTIPCQLSYNSEFHMITASPASYLDPNTSNSVTVTTGIKAISGLAMQNPVTWSFTTGSFIYKGDVTGNKSVGLEDILYLLQRLTGIRE
jgi:hypothetical protein